MSRSRPRSCTAAGSPTRNSAPTARGWPRRATTGRPGSGTPAPAGPIGPGRAAIGHAIGVGEVSFSPDGARVVTAGLDGTARIWDVASGDAPVAPVLPRRQRAPRTVHAGWIPGPHRRLRFDRPALERHRRRRLGGRRRGRRRDPSRGLRPSRPADRHGRRGRDGAGLGRRDRRADLAAAGPSRARDPRGVQPRRPVGRHGERGRQGAGLGSPRPAGRSPTSLSHDGPVRDVRFSPDGTRLATASADGRARIWDVATGRMATCRRWSTARRCSPWPSAPTAGGWPRPRSTGRRGSGTRPPAVLVLAPLEHGAPVSCVAFRPDGRALLTACSDSGFAELQARQWDLATGRPLGAPLEARRRRPRGRSTAPTGAGSPRRARTARPGSGTPPPASR